MADLYDPETDFEEFNPHPYQGGYDIVLTYGKPLPPSPTTCYPISSSKPSPPPVDPPPTTVERAPSAGEDRPSPDPVAGNPVLGYVDPRGYWFVGTWFKGIGEPWQWTADYLFGYLSVYGPKRHESHSYGNLNYAYERHLPPPPVSIELDPGCSQVGYANDGRKEGDGFGLGIFGNVGTKDYRGEVILPSEDNSYWNSCAYEGDDCSVPISFERSWEQEVDREHYVEAVQPEEYSYSCAYERNGCNVPIFFEQEVGWDHHVEVREEVYTGPESYCRYDGQDHEWRDRAVEDPGSFEMDYAGSFAEQLFGQRTRDVHYLNHCQEEPSYEDIEPFVPAWSRDSRYSYLYQQNVDPMFMQVPQKFLTHPEGDVEKGW